MAIVPFAKLRELLADPFGATAIEYALVAAVVAITAIGALMSFAGESGGLWDSTGDSLLNGFRGTVP